MATLVLPNGVQVQSLTDRNVGVLNYNVGSDCDMAEFFTLNFLTNCKNENIAVNRFRLHMIRQLDLDFATFKEMCSTNIQNGLESLFRHNVREDEICLLTKLINGGKLTIQSLFEKHKIEPSSYLIKFLL